MADNPTGKVCPGDCLQCTKAQQLYCASQSNLEIRHTQETIVELLKSIDQKLDRLLEGDDDKPSQVIKKGKAPKSSGAENKS